MTACVPYCVLQSMIRLFFACTSLVSADRRPHRPPQTESNSSLSSSVRKQDKYIIIWKTSNFIDYEFPYSHIHVQTHNELMYGVSSCKRSSSQDGAFHSSRTSTDIASAQSHVIEVAASDANEASSGARVCSVHAELTRVEESCVSDSNLHHLAGQQWEGTTYEADMYARRFEAA